MKKKHLHGKLSLKIKDLSAMNGIAKQVMGGATDVTCNNTDCECPTMATCDGAFTCPPDQSCQYCAPTTPERGCTTADCTIGCNTTVPSVDLCTGAGC